MSFSNSFDAILASDSQQKSEQDARELAAQQSFDRKNRIAVAQAAVTNCTTDDVYRETDTAPTHDEFCHEFARRLIELMAAIRDAGLDQALDSPEDDDHEPTIGERTAWLIYRESLAGDENRVAKMMAEFYNPDRSSEFQTAIGWLRNGTLIEPALRGIYPTPARVWSPDVEPIASAATATESAENQPDEIVPGYLGIRVDRNRREVSREGVEGSVTIGGHGEWQTFLVAYEAGERGATAAQWQKNYQGKWASRRKRKAALQSKLTVLDIAFKERELKLYSL